MPDTTKPSVSQALWQPIGTAPRDGTRVLGYGLWAGEINGIDPQPTICVIEWDGGRTDYPQYDWIVSYTDAYAAWLKPTHWMPVPEPPTPDMEMRDCLAGIVRQKAARDE